VNFVGHVVAAAQHHDDPDAVPAAVAVGVAHHRATDAAFHGDHRFIERCALVRDALAEAGVARGPARAAAHVGVELLLDDALLATTEGTAAFAPVWRRLSDPDATVLGVAAPVDRDRWIAWLGALTTRLDPWRHRGPPHAAARVHRLLSDRPRLALGATDLPALVASLGRARHAVDDIAGALVADAARHATGPDAPQARRPGRPTSTR
jgi:hypothetical protein